MKQFIANFSMSSRNKVLQKKGCNAAYVDVLVMYCNLLKLGWEMERNPSQMKNRIKDYQELSAVDSFQAYGMIRVVNFL